MTLTVRPADVLEELLASGRVYRWLRRCGVRHDDAEDIQQTALLLLFDRLEREVRGQVADAAREQRKRRVRSPVGVVHGIARFRYLDLLETRRRERAVPICGDLPARGEEPEDEEAVWARLGEILSAEELDLLREVAYSGLKKREIALRRGVSESGLSNRLARIRKKIPPRE